MNSTTPAGGGAYITGRQRLQVGSSRRKPDRPTDPLTSSQERGAAEFILTRPEIPTERSFGVPAGISGTPEALAAARAGAYWSVDELDLAWLNAWGPRPIIDDQYSRDGKLLAPRAVDICRGMGPRCETLVEWALVRSNLKRLGGGAR